MATVSDERSTKLAELESYCAGTPAREFSLTLEDGSTVFINVLGVRFKGHSSEPQCFAPSNSQINRAIADLARCEPLG